MFIKFNECFVDWAKENGMSLTTMALSFVNDRSFVTSNIIGATSIDQLKENIDSYKTLLSDLVLEEINNTSSFYYHEI